MRHNLEKLLQQQQATYVEQATKLEDAFRSHDAKRIEQCADAVRRILFDISITAARLAQ